MQNSISTKEFNKNIECGKKHSVSYYVIVLLMLYTVFFYFYKAFFEDALNDSWLSLLSVIMVFAVFCTLLLIYLLNTKKIFNKQFKLFCLFFVLIFISYLVTFSGLEKILGLCVILLSLLIFYNYPLKIHERKKLYYFFTIVVAILLLNGSTVENMYESANKFNPNTCGFLLTMLFCVSLVRFSKVKDGLCLAIAVISLFMQMIFTSRTALIGCILFLICFCLFKAWKSSCSKKTAFWIIFIFSMLGLVFAYIYSEILFSNIGHGKIFIFGKDIFTGRQTIWNFTFKSIKENFWFGVGSHLNEELLSEGYYDLIMNAHNQPLGMLAAFGFFSFLSFYFVFSKMIAEQYVKKEATHTQSISPLIFVAVITIMSYFDIYFLSEYNWLPIIIAYCLICSYSEKKKVKNENNNIYANV